MKLQIEKVKVNEVFERKLSEKWKFEVNQDTVHEFDEFDDWFNQIEAFSLRSERFYMDMKMLQSNETGIDKSYYRKRMVDWLRAAYESGQRTNLEEKHP